MYKNGIFILFLINLLIQLTSHNLEKGSGTVQSGYRHRI